MSKLDTAYNQLKELSHSTDYHHYLHNKYYTYQQQLKTINNKLNKEMAHIQDNRTPEQHFMDICRGWLVEDMLCYLFSLPPYKELTATFDNHDQDRIIRVMRREITAAPDFKITYRNKTIKIEVQSEPFKFLFIYCPNFLEFSLQLTKTNSTFPCIQLIIFQVFLSP